GPTIWKRKYGFTEYKINSIPLGGYVKPAGEDVAGSADKPWEYFAKPWYSRIIVVVSGPLMNYVLAFVLFTGLVFFVGEPDYSMKPVLGEVMASYPAEAAGLKAGDTILRVSTITVASWTDFSTAIHSRPQQPTEIVYSRGGVEASATVVPRLDEKTKFGLVGVTPQVVYTPVSFASAVGTGARQCWFWTYYTVKTLAEEIYNRRKPDVAGPVGIVQIVSKAAHSGMENFISLIALLSVAIGLFNLFPIPMLDGGTIVLFLWEGISRRKITEKLLERVNSVGMVLLVCLLVFATYSDIARIRKSRLEKAAAEKAKAEQAAPAAPAAVAAPPAGQAAAAR
ncbi:MAG: RIP metalloprotease RseP, partial [Elusimicrobiaceae bacterium]|nr:RIP metalloprotease RseP [Elusimicrobiaceae bacterium]